MNEEPGFFSKTRIAILGLGLMGGSLALALRGHFEKIYGIDPDPEAIRQAKEMLAIDEGSSDLEELLPLSNLVVLAAPVRTIIQLISQLPQLHPGSPVIIDFGSTKVDIMSAFQDLPPRFQPIGGHPMCGKERSTIFFAEDGLFRGASFILTPMENTTNNAFHIAYKLIELIGATPVLLDAHTHDRLMASTSHLPYLIANVLSEITSEETKKVLGPGFRSTARLSGSSPKMMLDILKTNRENILHQIEKYQLNLSLVETYLRAEDWEELINLLQIGSNNYYNLTQ